jgi:hypothetical protein
MALIAKGQVSFKRVHQNSAARRELRAHSLLLQRLDLINIKPFRTVAA